MTESTLDLRLPSALKEALEQAAAHLGQSVDEFAAGVLARTARGSGRYVAGAYEWRELPGIGHFPQEEAPETVSRAIAEWAR